MSSSRQFHSAALANYWQRLLDQLLKANGQTNSTIANGLLDYSRSGAKSNLFNRSCAYKSPRADYAGLYNQGQGQNGANSALLSGADAPCAQADDTGQLDNAKQGILNSFINGLGDLSRGYNENAKTAFAPENLNPDSSKGAMTRMSEALGTISRMAQNPAVQGIITGALTGGVTGNPLYGLANGYICANKKTKFRLIPKGACRQGA